VDLVIQAPHLAPDDVDALYALTGAAGVEPLTRACNDACRLYDIESDAGVDAACHAGGYDVARVEGRDTLPRVRVVAMDMDSTLITIECIDEIADLRGIKPEVAAITAQAMRGEIDFAESLRRRVALLAGVPEGALAEVYDDRLRLSPGAEALLAALHAQGATTLLLSGGFTFFTERLRARLGFTAALANTLEVVDGRLTGRLTGSIVDARAKAAALAGYASAAQRDGGIAVAIGDGANDIPMLEVAGVSVAWHAKPAARAAATHAIDHCGLDAVLNLFA
jgi:phosphoserine phosphatase